MSTDNLALVSFHLVIFQRDCLAWSPFLLQAGISMEILLERDEEAFAVWKTISARTPCLLHSSSASQRPCIPPLCLQSNGRLAEPSWISLDGGPTGGHRSDLHRWERASLGMIHPSAHRWLFWTLTESKQGLFLGGNVSQGWSLGGCRYQPQGAGWGPGSGTQNESDASDHLSSVGQRESSFRS